MHGSRAIWIGALALAVLFAALGGTAWVLGTPSDEGPVAEPAAIAVEPQANRPAGAAPTPAPLAGQGPAAETEPTPVSTPEPAWRGTQSATYLLLGLDRRSGEAVGRADVIIVAHADFQSRQASLLSVPRDLLVSIPGYERNRINAAYVYGEVDRRPGGGPALMQQTIEENFGIAVDHYAVLDFQCFRTVVDGVGGIILDVPTRIVDTGYPDDTYGYRTVVFEPGSQVMSGTRALEYVRTRATGSDFGRMHRQQQVITAIRERALGLDALAAVPTIFSECSGLRTNLSLADQLSLALAATEISSDEIALKVIEPPLVVDVVTPLGASMLQPRWELIRPLVQGTFLAQLDSRR